MASNLVFSEGGPEHAWCFGVPETIHSPLCTPCSATHCFTEEGMTIQMDG
jgi:hypothetical protein